MIFIQNVLWLFVLLLAPLVWLLRRYSSPHLVIYGHVGEVGGGGREETGAKGADSPPGDLAAKSYETRGATDETRLEVRFLIQNQRDMPVEGPIILTLEADPRGWLGIEGMDMPRLVHGPGLLKQPTCHIDPDAGTVVASLASNMRPLETWELSCQLAPTTPAVSLEISAGPTKSAHNTSGRVTLNLRRPVSGLSGNRLLDLGLSRSAWSFFLLVSTALGTVLVTWLLTGFSTGGGAGASWREILELVSELPAEVTGLALFVIFFCALSGWLVQQRPVPIIRGHKGEVRENSPGGTATLLSSPAGRSREEAGSQSKGSDNGEK